MVTVVAPDRNRSGASNSLTVREPLRVQQLGGDVFSVNGTPTDCVHLALSGLMGELPDLVISGVNAGRNLGDDTLYSGTVAAALEGRHLRCAGVAVSDVSLTPQHLETAVSVTCDLVERLAAAPLPSGLILNVNVPDVPFAELRGVAVTRLGSRGPAQAAAPACDPRGGRIWWIGEVGAATDCGPGTDFHAVAHGQVSITPLHADLTQHAAMDRLSRWAQPL